MASKPSSSVSDRTRLILWARSGGRCHYCNKDLIGDLLSGNAELVRGLVAHIVAESPGGPRGDAKRSPQLVDDVDNLMLMCHGHHREIDDAATRDKYPETRLLAMKQAHQHRIAVQTSITSDKATNIVRFGAKIGENQALLALPDMQNAVLPNRFPATVGSIDLEMVGCQYQDHEPDYWRIQRENLRRNFQQQVHGRIERSEVRHYSVFGLAPQPLLIELGRLLSDIVPADVYQRHREPTATWNWPSDGPNIEFESRRPEVVKRQVALRLEISAPISDTRIKSVLGDEVSIWSIAAAGAHNDILKTRTSQEQFREMARAILRDIKAAHGEHAEINVFPAMPVALAIELGRVWMPKADLPLVVFDQNRTQGGFIKTIEISAEPTP